MPYIHSQPVPLNPSTYCPYVNPQVRNHTNVVTQKAMTIFAYFFMENQRLRANENNKKRELDTTIGFHGNHREIYSKILLKDYEN